MDGEAPVPSAGKFQHPDKTALGEPRAQVSFSRLETLWINTGTLCNIECRHCYIESSPKNDRLSYLTAEEAAPFLDEAKHMGAREIGFTGGEPFMNPDMIEMTEAALSLGFEVLILTNAMRPMMRPKIRDALLSLNARYPGQLALRISFDHYDAKAHEAERGAGAFDLALAGVRWLSDNGLCFTIAGRGLAGENEDALRKGFAAFFAEHDIPLDASDPTQLIIFPEMDMDRDAPEITAACWRILDRNPEDMMCATSRMLIKRKGAAAPVLTSCTLLPYEAQFEMGASLAEAASPVKLNHPYCAQFCVLGGASCSN